jgi:hypothetical protein
LVVAVVVAVVVTVLVFPGGGSHLAIKSVSNPNPLPLSVLTVQATGLKPGTVSATFVNSQSGFARTETAIRTQRDGTVFLGTPLYLASSNLLPTSGAVNLTLTQGNETTDSVPIKIRDLPTAASYGTKLGEISHDFYVFQALIEAERLNQLQTASIAFKNKLEAKKQQSAVETMVQLLDATEASRTDADRIMADPSLTITGVKETFKDCGQPAKFNAGSVDMMDRIFGLYLVDQFAKFPESGNFHALAAHLTSSRDVTRFVGSLPSLDKNWTDVPLAFVKGLPQGMRLTCSAPPQALGVAVAALSAGRAAEDTTLNFSGMYQDATTRRVAQAGDKQRLTQQTAAAGQIAKAIMPLAGNLAGIKVANTASTNRSMIITGLATGPVVTDLDRKGLLATLNTVQIVDVTTVIEVLPTTNMQIVPMDGSDGVTYNAGGSIPSAEALIGDTTCCFGSNDALVMTLADPQGNYELDVPLGVQGVDYSNMAVDAFDFGTGNQVAPPISIDLSNAQAQAGTGTVITAPPLSGTCNDPDDNNDCD